VSSTVLDLRNVDKMSIEFALGTPFHPYEEIMGVLPDREPCDLSQLLQNSRNASRFGVPYYWPYV